MHAMEIVKNNLDLVLHKMEDRSRFTILKPEFCADFNGIIKNSSCIRTKPVQFN